MTTPPPHGSRRVDLPHPARQRGRYAARRDAERPMKTLPRWARRSSTRRSSARVLLFRRA